MRPMVRTGTAANKGRSRSIHLRRRAIVARGSGVDAHCPASWKTAARLLRSGEVALRGPQQMLHRLGEAKANTGLPKSFRS